MFSLFLFFFFLFSSFSNLVRLPCFLNNRQWTHFTTVSKRKENNDSFLQTTVAGGFCNVKNIQTTNEVLIVWLCPSRNILGGMRAPCKESQGSHSIG